MTPDEWDLDLGHGHFLRFTSWKPDRELNPQYEMPDGSYPSVEKFGAIVSHIRPDGTLCEGAITFNSELAERFWPGRTGWDVQSWEPLTISPSLLCKMPLDGKTLSGPTCDDHGFIRGGKWVPA